MTAQRRTRKLSGSLLGAGAFCAIALIGCHAGGSIKPEIPLRTADEIGPTRSPGDRAILDWAGTRIKVDLLTQLDRDTFRIDLKSDGEALDHEMYKFTPGGFSIARAAGETYSPPIPLLKFPMMIGDSWTWSGTLTSGGESLEGSAVVETDRKTEFACGEALQAVVSDVVLTINSVHSVKRELTFHFAKDRGLYRREFGESSVREPFCE